MIPNRRIIIEDLLEERGIGAVYRAHDLSQARNAALKVLYKLPAGLDQFHIRLMQEAISDAPDPNCDPVVDRVFCRDDMRPKFGSRFVPSGKKNADAILDQVAFRGLPAVRLTYADSGRQRW